MSESVRDRVYRQLSAQFGAGLAMDDLLSLLWKQETRNGAIHRPAGSDMSRSKARFGIDTFNRANGMGAVPGDASAVGVFPDGGPAWQVTGARLTGIQNGRLASAFPAGVTTGATYNYLDLGLDRIPYSFSCDVVWSGGTGAGTGGCAMLNNRSDKVVLENTVHLNFTEVGYAVSIIDGNLNTTPAAYIDLFGGVWSAAIVPDGVTKYRYSVVHSGYNEVTFIDHVGVPHVSYHPKWEAFWGDRILWEAGGIQGTDTCEFDAAWFVTL